MGGEKGNARKERKVGQRTSHSMKVTLRFLHWKQSFYFLSLSYSSPLPLYALLTCMMRCDGVSLPVVSLSSTVSAALREYDMLPSSNLHNNRNRKEQRSRITVMQ